MRTLGGGIIDGVPGRACDATLPPPLAGFVALSLGSLLRAFVAERGRLFGDR